MEKILNRKIILIIIGVLVTIWIIIATQKGEKTTSSSVKQPVSTSKPGKKSIIKKIKEVVPTAAEQIAQEKSKFEALKAQKIEKWKKEHAQMSPEEIKKRIVNFFFCKERNSQKQFARKNMVNVFFAQKEMVNSFLHKKK